MVRDTSLLAYMDLKHTLGERQRIVFETIKGSPMGITDIEIANELGFSDPNKVRPRRKELFDNGLIKAVGKRQDKFTNKMAYIWGL